MILEEIRAIRSGRQELKEFGLTMGVILGLIGGWLFLKGRPSFSWFLTLAAIFLFLGLVWPAVLKPFQKLWMGLAVVMGFFMSRLILLILFYLVITPLGIFLRLTGKDLLSLKLNRSTPSYWLPKKNITDKTSYEKQF